MNKKAAYVWSVMVLLAIFAVTCVTKMLWVAAAAAPVAVLTILALRKVDFLQITTPIQVLLLLVAMIGLLVFGSLLLFMLTQVWDSSEIAWSSGVTTLVGGAIGWLSYIILFALQRKIIDYEP